jgi:hypothetical protein
MGTFHVHVAGIPEFRRTYNSLVTAVSETQAKLRLLQFAAREILYVATIKKAKPDVRRLVKKIINRLCFYLVNKY